MAAKDTIYLLDSNWKLDGNENASQFVKDVEKLNPLASYFEPFKVSGKTIGVKIVPDDEVTVTDNKFNVIYTVTFAEPVAAKDVEQWFIRSLIKARANPIQIRTGKKIKPVELSKRMFDANVKTLEEYFREDDEHSLAAKAHVMAEYLKKQRRPVSRSRSAVRRRPSRSVSSRRRRAVRRPRYYY